MSKTFIAPLFLFLLAISVVALSYFLYLEKQRSYSLQKENRNLLSELSKPITVPTLTSAPTAVLTKIPSILLQPSVTPTKGPSYKYDADYPILLKMGGLGGTFFNSYGNGISGPYVLDKVFHPGDKLYIKAEAYDPKGRTINYKIELNTRNGAIAKSNQADITLTSDDISDSAGLTIGITVDTPYHRYSDLDDYMQFSFRVRP